MTDGMENLTINGREMERLDGQVMTQSLSALKRLLDGGGEVHFDGEQVPNEAIDESIERIAAAVFDVDEIVIEEAQEDT